MRDVDCMDLSIDPAYFLFVWRSHYLKGFRSLQNELSEAGSGADICHDHGGHLHPCQEVIRNILSDPSPRKPSARAVTARNHQQEHRNRWQDQLDRTPPEVRGRADR